MSDTPPRRRGRPPSIDRDAALEAALDVFWAKGYDGASLDDLTRAMKLSRPALYAAFGDKESLFRRALTRYAETDGSAALRAFEAAPCIEAAVTAFLTTTVRTATREDRPTGCFLSCAATQGQVAEAAREMVAAGSARAKARIVARFEEAIGAGLLSQAPSPTARAELLADMMAAIAARARTGEPQAALLAGLPDRAGAVLRKA